MPAPPGLFESASSKRDRLHSEISAGSRRGSPSGCIPNRHTTHGGPGDRRGLRIMRIVEAKLLEHPLEHDEQRGERQRDDGHEVDEDVHGRAGGILERIAHGIAHDSRLVGLGALAAMMTLLDVLLRVVPRAAGVGHEDGHEHAGGDGARKEAAQHGRVEAADGDRHDDGQASR